MYAQSMKEQFMGVIKVVFAGLITVLVFLTVTYAYIVLRTRGPEGGRHGSIGIDVAILPRLTIYSPLYWVVVVLVAVVLWWLLRHWLFA